MVGIRDVEQVADHGGDAARHHEGAFFPVAVKGEQVADAVGRIGVGAAPAVDDNQFFWFITHK